MPPKRFLAKRSVSLPDSPTKGKSLRPDSPVTFPIPVTVQAFLDGFKKRLGRPRRYETPEELHNAAVSHFELCYRHDEPLTWNGTVLALGFVEDQALEAQSERSEDFESVVKMIRKTVVEGYERDLRGKYMIGSIFALKNLAGWSDRQEVQVRGLMAGINLDRLNDEQLSRVKSGEHPLAVIAESIPGALNQIASGPPVQAPQRLITAAEEAGVIAPLPPLETKAKAKASVVRRSSKTAPVSSPPSPSIRKRKRTS